MARIFIVDDHDQFRRQLRSLIESQGGWVVCCAAADCREAVAKHANVNFDLTVIDFHMPGMDGLRASRRILTDNPNAAILMISVFASSQ